MGKGIIFTVIAFAIALFSFLVYDYIQGTVQDTMLDVSGQVVKDSQIDNASKTSLLSTFGIIKFVGVFATIGGVIFLVKKYFG